MSYDVSVGGEWFNYTFNMREFFQAIVAYPPLWEGMQASDVADLIDSALARVVTMSKQTLADYDAENGWGDALSAFQWLWDIRDEARRVDPKSIVTVSF